MDNAWFIPAWAGNTSAWLCRTFYKSVHPRVGGEHSTEANAVPLALGSSPRGRGTLFLDSQRRADFRFIPAWAGNTGLHKCRVCRQPVHPRVGGEHIRQCSHHSLPSGSSPRGRGTPEFAWSILIPTRFIPAWAGNTSRRYPSTSLAAVHPRVGGEHFLPLPPHEPHGGSSPRGRGTPVLDLAGFVQVRFIPAWAGNTQPACARSRARPVHPRVGGEHIAGGGLRLRFCGSSPRGRGTLIERAAALGAKRFIPAWAGNT